MKYLGGKQRLGKHLSPVLHELLSTYNTENEKKLEYCLDPFCGSLGVLKHLTDTGIPVHASDYHPDLICMWKGVQDGSLVFPESVSEEEFLRVKQLESPNALKAFVGFGMSFGGRFFGCYSQKYLGDKKEDFCKEMRNSLNRTRPLIKNVDFSCRDYKEWKPTNAFIYCDPPYKFNKFPVKYRTSTKVYDVFDNEEFWNVMREWSKTNLVLISEVTAPPDFEAVWTYSCVRSAAQSSKTRNCAKSAVKSETHCVEKLFKYRGETKEEEGKLKG
jgi:DNA adenine methylase